MARPSEFWILRATAWSVGQLLFRPRRQILPEDLPGCWRRSELSRLQVNDYCLCLPVAARHGAHQRVWHRRATRGVRDRAG